jgi:hypothetical protein
VPALFVLVPQHPQVAEVDRQGREIASDETNEGSPVADRRLTIAADDADADGALARRLAVRPSKYTKYATVDTSINRGQMEPLTATLRRT